REPPTSTLCPYTTLFRSDVALPSPPESVIEPVVELSVRPASKVTLPALEVADTLPVKLESPVAKATSPPDAFRFAVPTLALLPEIGRAHVCTPLAWPVRM